MTRRLLLHPDEPLLLVQSEYNDRIRLTVKSFQGARWDGQRRVWQLPLEHRDRVIELLAPFDFAIDDEVLEIEGEPTTPPIDPSDETASTRSRASWPTESSTRRTSAMGLVIAVDVSL